MRQQGRKGAFEVLPARLLLIAGLGATAIGLAVAGGPGRLPQGAGSAPGRAVAAPGVLVDRTWAAAPLERTLAPGEPAPADRAVSPPVAATSRIGSVDPEDGAATVSEREDAVVALTNAERLAAGCPRLVRDGALALAAARHARDLVRRDYFEHVSPDGLGPGDRARTVGFPGGVGENLAVGYVNAQDVVHGWMTSPGHRANILECRFALIGVAYLDQMIPSKQARGVWVQEFGTAASD